MAATTPATFVKYDPELAKFVAALSEKGARFSVKAGETPGSVQVVFQAAGQQSPVKPFSERTTPVSQVCKDLATRYPGLASADMKREERLDTVPPRQSPPVPG
jgi:hypothetical protein